MSAIKIFISTCFFAICALTQPGEAAHKKAIVPTEEIPHDFSSWSLFLVCNPAWIIRSGDTGVRELYGEFSAFGRSIGDNNVAVWFWKNPKLAETANNTDIERSITYCKKYKLLPSEGPHVLVTTGHPDDPNPGDRVVVRLNGLAANESVQVLAKLADQLVVTKLSQTDLDAQQNGWPRVLDAIYAAVAASGCYFNKVSFSLKTGVINAEIGHSTEGGKGC